MNYLFIDIECANCFEGTGKICEFGYVLTDESLHILRKGIFLINPDAEFDWYVKHKIISYRIADYIKQPTYPRVYYDHIQKLLSAPDTLLVGHGIRNDIKFLNNEATRYGLPPIKLLYVDTSTLRQHITGETREKKLKTIVQELGIGDPKCLHNSQYDALMTHQYIKFMCAESGKTFAQLINDYASIHTSIITKEPLTMSKNKSNVSSRTHSQAQLDHYANQSNRNNAAHRANQNNHANQCNPNNKEYGKSNGGKR